MQDVRSVSLWSRQSLHNQSCGIPQLWNKYMSWLHASFMSHGQLSFCIFGRICTTKPTRTKKKKVVLIYHKINRSSYYLNVTKWQKLQKHSRGAKNPLLTCQRKRWFLWDKQRWSPEGRRTGQRTFPGKKFYHWE